MNTIQVKYGKLGARTEEYTLAENATVGHLLTAASADVAGYTPRVNGDTANISDTLEDGDIVTLMPSVKGGSN